MEDNKYNRKEILVGAFVVFGVFIFLIGMLYSNKDIFHKKGREYSVLFNSLEGLKVSSPVQFAGGINVGKVTRIEVEGKQAKIFIVINNDEFQVTPYAIFSIGSNGLLGESYLSVSIEKELSQNSVEILSSGEVKPGSTLQGSNTGNVGSALDAIEVLSRKVMDLVDTMNLTLKDFNDTGTLKKTMESLYSISKNVENIVIENRGSIHSSVKDLELIINDINQGKGILGDLINNKNRKREFEYAMRGLIEIVQDLHNILGNLRQKKKSTPFLK